MSSKQAESAPQLLPAHPASPTHEPPQVWTPTPSSQQQANWKWWGGNPLIAQPEIQPRETLLCWSGSLPDPIATWAKPGWEALLAWLQDAVPTARERGARIVLRPHFATVLSDAQRCIAIVQAIDEPTLSIALDPLAMLTESMLDDADDHTRRAVDGALAHTRIGALIRPSDDPLGAIQPHLDRAHDTLPPEIPRFAREPWSPQPTSIDPLAPTKPLS